MPNASALAAKFLFNSDAVSLNAAIPRDVAKRTIGIQIVFQKNALREHTIDEFAP